MTESIDAPRIERWIRLMADYSSTGIWLSDGTMGEPEELPVSSRLHARIETWCSWYERNQDYLFPHERTTVFDYASFGAEGLAIARAIKAELPDWIVVYFDEAACVATQGDEACVRETYEYEVR